MTRDMIFILAVFIRENPWLSIDIVSRAIIITVFYVTSFNAVRLFS